MSLNGGTYIISCCLWTHPYKQNYMKSTFPNFSAKLQFPRQSLQKHSSALPAFATLRPPHPHTGLSPAPAPAPPFLLTSSFCWGGKFRSETCWAERSPSNSFEQNKIRVWCLNVKNIHSCKTEKIEMCHNWEQSVGWHQWSPDHTHWC